MNNPGNIYVRNFTIKINKYHFGVVFFSAKTHKGSCIRGTAKRPVGKSI